MEWKIWENKRIFLRLKTGDCYTGVITSVEGDTISGFLTMIDKYDDTISVAISEISKIKEEKNGR